MNRFDLYIMVYYTLDKHWDKTRDESLGLFLSGMNPFLFQGEGSAVPDIYSNYCRFLDGRDISIENSYETAKAYVASLNEDYISEAFAWMTPEKWREGCNKYLSASFQ